jgi:hypothetical protein
MYQPMQAQQQQPPQQQQQPQQQQAPQQQQMLSPMGQPQGIVMQQQHPQQQQPQQYPQQPHGQPQQQQQMPTGELCTSEDSDDSIPNANNMVSHRFKLFIAYAQCNFVNLRMREVIRVFRCVL